MQQELSIVGDTEALNDALSVPEARRFAKYYGNVLRNANNVAWDAETLRHFWDALYYCRWVILKQRIKR